MSSNTTDAQDIKKQDFSCVIRKIECHYTIDKESKTSVFFNRGTQNPTVLRKAKTQEQQTKTGGTLQGSVTNTKDSEYYFITNYKGKDVNLKCERTANRCTIDEHKKYVVDYIDINDKQPKSQTKDISDEKLKLYYFDIFTRTSEYAVTGAQKGGELGYEAGKYVCSRDGDSAVGGLAGGATGGMAGLVAGATYGNLADLICSLRFIHLPRINFSDNDYGCHDVLIYNECPHEPSVPEIIINTYPDIEFNLKLGVLGYSKTKAFKSTKEKPGDKTEKTPFSFEFKVKYASSEKSISFEKKVEEKDLKTDEEKKGGMFANAIHALKEFLEMAVSFTQTLKELMDNASAGDKAALEKQLTSLSYKPGGADWLKGSLEISPELSGKWKYSVSDDLARLGKYVNLELGIDCTGTITIDLIELGSMLLSKSKKTAKVAAVAGSIASGGLAALPAALLTFLVDYVVDWLIDKFKEGLVFDFMLIGKASLKACSLTWDTSKDQIFDGQGLTAEIKPEIKIVLGVDYKTSVTLFWVMKAEGEAKATAEASASLTWTMSLNVKEGYLGVDHDCNINPLILKVECKVEGSFEVSYSSDEIELGTKSKNSLVDYSNEWKTKEYKYEIGRHNWFKVVND